MWKTWVQSLGWEDPLEEGLATRSSVLAWRISMDRGAWWAAVHGHDWRVRHDWSDWARMHTHKTSIKEGLFFWWYWQGTQSRPWSWSPFDGSQHKLQKPSPETSPWIHWGGPGPSSSPQAPPHLALGLGDSGLNCWYRKVCVCFWGRKVACESVFVYICEWCGRNLFYGHLCLGWECVYMRVSPILWWRPSPTS